MGAMRVGVIGLGSMGMGVAASVLRPGHAVFGCDIRPEPRASLAAQGGRACATPAEAAMDAETLILLVVNAAQVDAALFGPDGAAARMKPGGVILQSATVAPDYPEALAARLAPFGLRLIDAPVSGGAVGAQSGRLTLMASGDPAAFAACESVLSAIAAKVYRLGDAPGAGSRVKLINQLLAGAHIAVAAEAMALAIRLGADPATVYEVITNSAGGSWMFANRMQHVLDGDYAPRSAVNIFVKDLGIVLDTARQAQFPTPMAATALQLFTMAAAQGLAGEDDAAVIKVFRALAGIDLPAKPE
jgi:3-hydroxyisobutyrate dehydrogenase